MSRSLRVLAVFAVLAVESVEPVYRPAFEKLLESLKFLKDNPLE